MSPLVKRQAQLGNASAYLQYWLRSGDPQGEYLKFVSKSLFTRANTAQREIIELLVTAGKLLFDEVNAATVANNLQQIYDIIELWRKTDAP